MLEKFKLKISNRSIYLLILVLPLLLIRIYATNAPTQKPNTTPTTSTTSPIKVQATLEIVDSKTKDNKTYLVKGEMLPPMHYNKASFWEQVTKIAATWGPIIVGLFAVFISYLGIRKSNRQLMEQIELSRTEKRRADILIKLNTFYGPFKELRTQSRTLYGKFMSLMRLEYGDGIPQKGFRTLTWLLEGKRIKRKANTIFQQIIEIEEHLLQLIQNNTGVVDKPDLQDLLGKFAAHIRVLRLAYERRIGGESETAEIFEDLVYPYEVDGAIESATLRLQFDLNKLEQTRIHSRPIPKWKEYYLKIKNRPNSTIEYYNTKAEEYSERWDSIDFEKFYKLFQKRIPRGGRILDVGCGSGRDTRHFIKKGYRVVSIDASEQMVKLCNAYPHAFCINQNIQDINFMEEFDGVWCCASLLTSA